MNKEFKKGRHILYQDENGSFKVDSSMLRPDDNRDFGKYVLSTIVKVNKKTFEKIEHISASGYLVTLYGFKLTNWDVNLIKYIFKKASITSNVSSTNRDITEINIDFKGDK